MSELRIRHAVRALLITPEPAVLLCRFEFPSATVWAVPGGGLDPGEDHLTALHRELAEEVGLRGVEPGPHVWNREHIIPFIDGQWDGQLDRYYLLPVIDRFEPQPDLSWDQLRDERLHELRWWSVDEIDDATSAGVRFAPARLGGHLRRLVDEGPPDDPIDTGI